MTAANVKGRYEVVVLDQETPISPIVVKVKMGWELLPDLKIDVFARVSAVYQVQRAAWDICGIDFLGGRFACYGRADRHGNVLALTSHGLGEQFVEREDVRELVRVIVADWLESTSYDALRELLPWKEWVCT